MSPEQLEEMQVAAAVRMQTMFRGFRARWKVLHPKVFSKGMRDADEHEREESWHRYLRAWQEVRALPACRTLGKQCSCSFTSSLPRFRLPIWDRQPKVLHNHQ